MLIVIVKNDTIKKERTCQRLYRLFCNYFFIKLIIKTKKAESSAFETLLNRRAHTHEIQKQSIKSNLIKLMNQPTVERWVSQKRPLKLIRTQIWKTKIKKPMLKISWTKNHIVYTLLSDWKRMRKMEKSFNDGSGNADTESDKRGRRNPQATVRSSWL